MPEAGDLWQALCHSKDKHLGWLLDAMLMRGIRTFFTPQMAFQVCH